MIKKHRQTCDRKAIEISFNLWKPILACCSSWIDLGVRLDGSRFSDSQQCFCKWSNRLNTLLQESQLCDKNGFSCKASCLLKLNFLANVLLQILHEWLFSNVSLLQYISMCLVKTSFLFATITHLKTFSILSGFLVQLLICLCRLSVLINFITILTLQFFLLLHFYLLCILCSLKEKNCC